MENRVRRRTLNPRPAMTLMEMTVALAIVGVLAVIVAQCIVLTMRERARMATHQAALELAANVLETARAQPWDRLNQAWADTQAIPSEMAALLPDGKIVVAVEPTQAPHTRRVSAEVRWTFDANMPRSVRLLSLFTERTANKPGGKP